MQLVHCVTRHVAGDDLNERPISIVNFTDRETAVQFCEDQLRRERLTAWTFLSLDDTLDGPCMVGDFTITPVQVCESLAEAPRLLAIADTFAPCAE